MNVQLYECTVMQLIQTVSKIQLKDWTSL